MALLGGSQGLAGGNAAPQQNCVLMFYGMNGEMMNCDRLFNLVCLYGNVVRIKFLKSKDGAAMVQVRPRTSWGLEGFKGFQMLGDGFNHSPKKCICAYMIDA